MSSAALRPPRATWVWDFDDPSDVVSFADRHALTELFVAVPRRIDTDQEREPLIRLADAAHRRGIVVAALGGDPSWIDRPDDALETWLAPALGLGVFDGIHLDVEPDFDEITTIPTTAARLVELTARFAAERPAAMRLEMDVRFWYVDVPFGSSDLTTELVAVADAVTVLSYRHGTDGVDGSVAISRPTAARAMAAGCSFRIGQETRFLGLDPDCRKQTFFGRPRAELETAMARLDDEFGPAADYVGTAVHDWRGYGQLPGRCDA